MKTLNRQLLKQMLQVSGLAFFNSFITVATVFSLSWLVLDGQSVAEFISFILVVNLAILYTLSPLLQRMDWKKQFVRAGFAGCAPTTVTFILHYFILH